MPSIADISPTLSPGRIGIPVSGSSALSRYAANCPDNRYVDGVVRFAGLQQDCAGGQDADLAILDRVDDGGRVGAAKQGDRVDSRPVLVPQLESQSGVAGVMPPRSSSR